MIKYVATEAANKVCYDAQQVFGGMGYMKETGIEQLVRDVRITTIYEGTSQVQVSASIKAVLADVLADVFDKKSERSEAMLSDQLFANLFNQLLEIRGNFSVCAQLIKQRADESFTAASAQGLVDCYCGILAGHLLLDQIEVAEQPNLKQKKLIVATRYINRCYAQSLSLTSILKSDTYLDVAKTDILFDHDQN